MISCSQGGLAGWSHGDFSADLRTITINLPSVTKLLNDSSGIEELPKYYANTLNPRFGAVGMLLGVAFQHSFPQVSWISGKGSAWRH